jgi:hypothetical protein
MYLDAEAIGHLTAIYTVTPKKRELLKNPTNRFY